MRVYVESGVTIKEAGEVMCPTVSLDPHSHNMDKTAIEALTDGTKDDNEGIVGKNYWCGRDNHTSLFVIDMEKATRIKNVYLRNSYNHYHYDRQVYSGDEECRYTGMGARMSHRK